MIPLVKLKKDVAFNGLFTKIVDAMKNIAAARFHVLQRQMSLFEPFSDAAGTILAGLNLQGLSHPFLQATHETTHVILVTSDEGFLGGLNAQIVNAGLQEGGSGCRLTVIGTQGRQYLRDAQSRMVVFAGITDVTSLNPATELDAILSA